MLQLLQVETALLFSLAAFCLTNVCLKFGSKQDSRQIWSLYLAIGAVIVLASVKLYYDASQGLPMNYYGVMEVSRHHNVLDIRRSYKSLSRKYHPDKNPEPDAELAFNNIKIAYDVLIDEAQRDLYNRFGPGNVEFDPRKDEIKLMIDVATGFLFWSFFTYVVTIPVSWRGSRSWIAVLALFCLVVEVTFTMSEVEIPTFLPPTLTEFELIFYLHSIFPVVVMLLGIIAQYFYVDVDQTSIDTLNHVIVHQKAMSEMLGKVEHLLEVAKSANPSGQQKATEECKERINELRESMEEEAVSLASKIQSLKSSASSLAGEYHWVVLVVVYGLIFYLGAT
jgi:hypothetical protein